MDHRRAARGFVSGAWAIAALSLVVAGREAHADERDTDPSHPPPLGHSYLQYGVAFTVEGVASAGPICSSGGQSSEVAAKVAAAGCILGSGGGIAIRVGWRPTEYTYFGGAYEFSKQDPNNLYRLGILQQARVEARHYFAIGWRGRPYGMIAAGASAYGNEWGIDTWGLTAAIGAGLELEVSGTATIGLAIVYRPLYLRSWIDSSLIPHPAGVAQMIGIELALEAQDRL